MIWVLVAVRSIADKDIPPGKEQSRTLILHERIKAGSFDSRGSIGKIRSRGKVQGVEALCEPATRFGQGDHIQGGLCGIDYGSPNDSHVAVDVSAAKVRIIKAGGRSEVDMPEGNARAGVVRIERIHAVVDRGHMYDIVPIALYFNAGHQKWLCI